MAVTARHRHLPTWRRWFIRIVALLACAAALLGIAGSLYAYRQVYRARDAALREARQVADICAAASASLRTTSAAASGAATSLESAQSTLTSTSATTRSVAGALEETGSTLNISIFGLGQPFAEVEQTLRGQATQLRTLAGQIDQTGGTLTQNTRDLRTLGGDTAQVAAQLDTSATQLRQFAAGGPGSAIDSAVSGVHLLIGWIVVVHMLLLGLGMCLYLLTLEPLPAPHIEPVRAGDDTADEDDTERG